MRNENKQLNIDSEKITTEINTSWSIVEKDISNVFNSYLS